MKLKFFGTGTSQGIPVIGNTEPVCLSDDSRDRRLRTSALITTDSNKKILIDCGPDFRQQMLSNNEKSVDAVLLTHEHNDHTIGLDDLRPVIFNNKKNMPIYCLERVGCEVKQRFPYAFETENKYPGAPNLDMFYIDDLEVFDVFDASIFPIHILHGTLPIVGYKIKNLAYITDAKFIPTAQYEKLQNLDVLIINSLRKEILHETHFIIPEIIELTKILNPKTTYITHISYKMGFHEEVEKELPEGMHLAFDSLEIDF